jgi:hypothetical protein
MLSAQFVILRGLTKNKMRAVVSAQAYDSVTGDVPYDEVKQVDEIVHNALTNPPLRGILEVALGRTMPIEFERKVLL